MAEQPTLFQPPPATGKLSDRQRFLYEKLLAATIHGDGLDADEAGALLHERSGKHMSGLRCSWCHQDGQGVLRALRNKGLARKPRTGPWRALADEAALTPPEPRKGDPFPGEGF